MKLFKIILFLYFLIINTNGCFGQIAYVLKLVIKQDKKIIQIIETSGGKEIRQVEIATTSTLNDIARKKIFNKALSPEECKKIIIQEVNAGHISASDAIRLKVDAEIQRISYNNTTTVGNGKTPELLKNIRPTPILIGKPPKLNPTPLSLKEIQHSNIFLSIPSTEFEYKAIFGKENFDKSQFRNILKLRKKLYDEKNPHAYFLNASDQLLYELKQNNKQEKSFIIIGHNDNGKLMFPDGSSIELKKIDHIANSLSKVVVFLSCNAKSFTEINPATNYYLTYNEAVKLVHRIDFRTPNPKAKISHELLKIIYQATINQYGKEKKLKYDLKLVCYVIGSFTLCYGLYEIKSDNRSKTKPTKGKN